MVLLSWNIQHGGGTRSGRIVEALLSHDPDVIALSEFRGRTGAPHAVSTKPDGRVNGLCILSRTPIRCARKSLAPVENARRWLDVDFPEYGFGVGLFHILCSVPGSEDRIHAEAKIRFWDAVLQAAEERSGEPFLFIGDWNTGAPHLDDERSRNPDTREFTWYSKLKGGAPGKGFRLDHAFASPSLAPRVKSCRYSHKERVDRISDHSILLAEIASTS